MIMQKQPPPSPQSEVSLLDIVNFLQDAWKKLVIAAVVGAVLGFANWFFNGGYQAELMLVNNGGANLLELRSLQKTLPNLAKQSIEQGKVPQDQESLYRTFSNSDWWLKNVVPTFGLSKAESKELASTVGLELAGTAVASLAITAGGDSKNNAIENTLSAKNFLLQGASYLSLKSMFNAQESELIGADADLEKKINAAHVELAYQEQRLKSLEILAKRFPGDAKVSTQVIDLKNSDAKYLPISTQIIAANIDINASKETLERLKDTQAQIAILRVWVKQVSPLMESTFDGLALNKQLLEQEARLRSTLGAGDPKSFIFVDTLRSNLIANSVRYSKGFVMNAAQGVIDKKSMLKSTAVGLAATFFLMLLVLLGQRIWLGIKPEVPNEN